MGVIFHVINYNLILYIGIGLILVCFIGFIISEMMDRHYEVKLFELNQKMKELNKKAERVLK